MATPYIHREVNHNTRAAEVIVPELIRLFRPTSVLDVGCGIGTFLHVFRHLGVEDVVGVDGAWTNRTLLDKYLPAHLFLDRDLTQPLHIARRFDLAISLEVAEHLPESAADQFIDSLVLASDTVIFSAATPGQGGQNHLNEQPVHYWIAKFRERGYRFIDCLRPLFWQNSQVDSWYRQNMVVFVADGLRQQLEESDARMAAVVHPDSWQAMHGANYFNIINGRAPLSTYLKLFLIGVVGPTTLTRCVGVAKQFSGTVHPKP